MEGKKRLYWLIELYLQEKLSTRDFCNEFETTYNFALDDTLLSANEKTHFEELFDAVVYYSEFPEDRAAYPGYTDETRIRSLAQKTWDSLMKDNSKPEAGSP